MSHLELNKKDGDEIVIEYVAEELPPTKKKKRNFEHDISNLNAAQMARQATIYRDNPLRLVGCHTPICVSYTYYCENKQGQIEVDKRRVCVVCKKRSKIICVQCNIGLHIRTFEERGCWEIYHSADYTGITL